MSRPEHDLVEAELPGGVWLRYDELAGLNEADAKARFGTDVYDRVAADLRARLAEWGPNGPFPSIRAARLRPRVWAEPLAQLLYCGALLALALWAVWLAAILAVIGAIVLCIAGVRHRAAVLMRRAVGERVCRRCDFDLSGSPGGLPAVAARGADPGPSRCPECGLPWPLVPPHR